MPDTAFMEIQCPRAHVAFFYGQGVHRYKLPPVVFFHVWRLRMPECLPSAEQKHVPVPGQRRARVPLGKKPVPWTSRPGLTSKGALMSKQKPRTPGNHRASSYSSCPTSNKTQNPSLNLGYNTHEPHFGHHNAVDPQQRPPQSLTLGPQGGGTIQKRGALSRESGC